jgi:hypothetical protein
LTRARSLSSLLLVCCVFGVLFGPGLASGTAGVSSRGFDLGFDGKYRHGHPVKVKNFTFSFIDVKCDGGAATQASNSDAPLPAMKVKRRKFHGAFNDHGMKTAVTGKYAKSLKKVTGTLRVTGKVGGLTHCDSGTVRWETN